MIKTITEFFRSKKIFTAISLYVAGVWLIIRVLVTISPYLDIPNYWVNVTMYAGIMLLPIFLFHLFVIHYDPRSDNKLLSKLYHLSEEAELRVWPKILVVLAFSITSFFLVNSEDFGSNQASYPSVHSDNKLAVTYFQNQTGDKELDVLGPMITHWLTEGFIQNGIVKIASTNSIKEVYASSSASTNLPNTTSFQKLLGTKYTIDGVYFLQGDTIILTSNLVDSYTGKIVHSFGEFRGDKEKPLDLIEELRQQSLGYWFNRDKIDRFPPPRYDAYKKYIEAQQLWREDDEKVTKLLEESLHLDPTFLEPYFLLTASYRNSRNWNICDSLLNILNIKKPVLTKSQLTKYNYFKNELGGDFKNAFKFLKEEYDRDKSDVFMNTSLMHFANYRLNDPELCLVIASNIGDKEIDYDNCKYCKSRLYSLARAEYQSGSQEKVSALHRYNTKINNYQLLEEVFLLSAIAQKSTETVDSIMQTIKVSGNQLKYIEQGLVLITKYLYEGDQASADQWINAIGTEINNSQNTGYIFLELKAKWYEIQDDNNSAMDIYQQLYDSSRDDFYNWRIYGVLAQNGEEEMVQEFINKQVGAVGQYDFGYQYYEIARLYALLGNTDSAIKYLRMSIKSGRQFHISFFDQDWYLHSIWKEPTYRQLLLSRRVSF